MSNEEFRAFLDLMMCSDSWPVSTSESQELLEEFADRHSRELGFDGWIVAYHEFQPEEEKDR